MFVGLNVAGGSGIGSDSADEDELTNGGSGSGSFGDDCAGASSRTNLFRSAFTSPYRRASIKGGSIGGSTEGDDDEAVIPPQIQFAASMSELHRLATERFSDDEAGESDRESDIESDSDDSDDSDGGGVVGGGRGGARRRGSVKVTREKPTNAFRRVSAILFGGQKSVDKSSGAGSEMEDGSGISESEYETDTSSSSEEESE